MTGDGVRGETAVKFPGLRTDAASNVKRNTEKKQGQ